MSMLRALRNNQNIAARLMRTFSGKPTTTFAQRNGIYATTRSFASEPGFLDRADVTERVLQVVKKFEKVEPEKVTEESHFVDDLGLDSLDTVELVMAMEDEFTIEIPDADAEKILTCQDAVEYLSNNVHAK